MDWRLPWGRKESDTQLSDLHFRELISHASCDMAKNFFKKSWDWKEVLEIRLYLVQYTNCRLLRLVWILKTFCYFDLVYSFDS